MNLDEIEDVCNESQIILVCVNGTNANVYMCEKVNKKWITIMSTLGFIGKNGIGKEIEGDLKTPTGLYGLGIALGTHDNVKTILDYYQLNENMYWVCDSDSKYYNQLIDCEKIICDWNNLKNEHLIEENIAYEYAIEIKYNAKCEPQKGSAIFLHCVKDGPTAGCVSISKENMKFVLEHVKKNTKILIV